MAIQQTIDECRDRIRTPYYLIDESRLLPNLQRIAELRERTGVRSVLALKCFSTPALFDLMRPYLDGTTSSSLFEARLGHERFGKEVHVYGVAFSDDEIAQARPLATKVIFNSVSQLARHRARVAGVPLGLRVNPGISYSRFDLADPARPHSRLGVAGASAIETVAGDLSGLMFHCNCENGDLEALTRMLDRIGESFGSVLRRMDWVSLGGGISFTAADYPFDGFCELLGRFAARFDLQLYLEPGSAVVADAGFLVTQVLDLTYNGRDIAVVDAALEAHMLDFLIYRLTARIDGATNVGDTDSMQSVQSVQSVDEDGRVYDVTGRSCLAGDVFGTFRFPAPLEVGSVLAIADAADYTLVKKHWFNGLPMPSIVVRRLNGDIDIVRTFGYDDYLRSHC